MENPVTTSPAPAKKTGAILATVVTAILCGCTGLLTMCWGLIAAVLGLMPNTYVDFFEGNTQSGSILAGFGALCGGVVLVAIPVVVGVVTLRKKKEPAAEPAPGGISPVP